MSFTATAANLASSNVADVFNSIINMLGTGLIMIVIMLVPGAGEKIWQESRRRRRLRAGDGRAHWRSISFSPTNIWGMLGITPFVAICYAPTIPLTWAIFADVADYSEWKVGRRFTGMVFATIGFALESRAWRSARPCFSGSWPACSTTTHTARRNLHLAT